MIFRATVSNGVPVIKGCRSFCGKTKLFPAALYNGEQLLNYSDSNILSLPIDGFMNSCNAIS